MTQILWLWDDLFVLLSTTTRFFCIKIGTQHSLRTLARFWSGFLRVKRRQNLMFWQGFAKNFKTSSKKWILTSFYTYKISSNLARVHSSCVVVTHSFFGVVCVFFLTFFDHFWCFYDFFENVYFVEFYGKSELRKIYICAPIQDPIFWSPYCMYFLWEMRL